MKKYIIILIVIIFIGFFAFSSSDTNTNYVNVEYRSNPVNVSSQNFEFLDTSMSSWIRGAWYDRGNNYMVINLNGSHYHYCGVPYSTWDNFKYANSFGSAYNQYIKGSYDCRYNPVPSY